jgi:hypothetical protein
MMIAPPYMGRNDKKTQYFKPTWGIFNTETEKNAECCRKPPPHYHALWASTVLQTAMEKRSSPRSEERGYRKYRLSGELCNRAVARSARYEREASTPTLRAAPGTWVGLRLFRTPCDVASRRCLALRANVMTVSSPLATQTGRPRHFRKFL